MTLALLLAESRRQMRASEGKVLHPRPRMLCGSCTSGQHNACGGTYIAAHRWVDCECANCELWW